MIRRIRNTFEELIPIRHWKFECPYLKNNLKISTEAVFLLSPDRHFRYKAFLRCEVWCYTKAGRTDQSEVMRDNNEGGWIDRE